MSETEDSQDFVYSSDSGDIDTVTIISDFTDDYNSSYSSNSCITMSFEQLYSLVNNILSRISVLLQISEACARCLLDHLLWNEEKLVDLYFSEYKNKLLSETNMDYLNNLKYIQAIDSICLICLDVDVKGYYSEHCGHYFCNSCWKNYIIIKIQIGFGDRCVICCPMMDCPVVINDDIIINILSSMTIVRSYKVTICRSFTKFNSMYKSCPIYSCDNFIKLYQIKAKKVICICGQVFCFKCCSTPHEPIDCELLKYWVSKSDCYKQDIDWLRFYSKECPKCNTYISKSGGCNKIKCPSTSCDYSFCWVCLKPWSTHQSNEIFSCNKYEAPSDHSHINEDSKRWNFYYLRYHNYQNLINVSRQYKTKFGQYFKNMNHNLTETQQNTINNITDRLVECEETLMYSYIFSCAVIENNHFCIFTSNQRNLEIIIENCVNFIENVIQSKDFNSYSTIHEYLHNNISLCERRRNILVGVVDEGFSTNQWTFKQEWNYSSITNI